MNRSLAIAADKASGLSLKLIAAVNVLFLVSFLVITLVAAGAAGAGEAKCTGTSLVDELAQTDPAALERIRAEAARTPNGQGLLWKVAKEGSEPSFLFGTMHITDPRVVNLTPAAEKAFADAETVVIETTEVLDQASAMAAMMQRPDLMMFTDDSTIFSLMSPEEEAVVREGLQRRGIPPASIQKMKPWMLAAAVALPACEMARKAAGEPFLDIRLAEDAKKEGKTLAGLETLVGQLDAMASLPMDFHVKGLVATLALGPRMDDVFETMIVLYDREETGMIWPLFETVLPSPDDDGSGYAAFEEAMINTRNRTMADNADPYLADGRAFIAVGALHLPGEDGLVALLRERGYRVSRVD
ncbi:polysaccharide biosynthesis protein GumN [Nitratireductor mangrovi]|uniref:Polysaccharide biosynthesis protein GumN n=1 Tax=Nitratireductor mangrovi TaxID=2599600 RepID=A0A5B8L1H9_9HYPH|nr:TraB/GumN family protein [Nitratireductor mangrovi]QDZ01673.1 polysaccharide biosynthesis protein GumN [Nitratireductor mangrovi]